jgi:hypothetical protein
MAVKSAIVICARLILFILAHSKIGRSIDGVTKNKLIKKEKHGEHGADRTKADLAFGHSANTGIDDQEQARRRPGAKSPKLRARKTTLPQAKTHRNKTPRRIGRSIETHLV